MKDAISLEGGQKYDYLDPQHSVVYDNNVKLYRMDSRGMRYYYRIEGGQVYFYGSVTSVKKQVTGLPRPIIDKMVEMGAADFDAYLNSRAHRGTFFHIQAAELTRQGFYDTNKVAARIAEYAAAHGLSAKDTWGWHDDIIKGLQSWLATMQDYQITPLAVEIPLYVDYKLKNSPEPVRVAGTIDLVCQMNANKYTEKTPESKRKRITAIIDWKSGGIFPDYAMQLELNKLCWAYCLPDAPAIQSVYNWSWNDWRTAPTYTMKDQTGSIWADPALMESYLTIYAKEGKLEPAAIKSFTGMLKLDTDLTQANQTISASEYIIAHHES